MDTHLTWVSAWRDGLLMLAGAFTRPSARTFLELLRAWVLCTGRRTVTGMVRFVSALESRSHDVFHRFLAGAQWEMQEVWRDWALFAVGCWAPTGQAPLDLDDTLFHRTGRKVEGAGWWRDAVRSTGTRVVHAWGLNLVVLTLRVRPP
jgi:hypothetical protein